ncbi:MAG: Asp23/Gls24 family envelope stress response protein [Blautia sp.]|nr:Asp23/Gls24 family envelope stress response protein [Blautia sp.]
MAEKRTTYKIKDLGGIGQVNIADEVVTVVAGLAATEADGVASIAGNITNELVSRLGVKNLSKGVRVSIKDDVVTVDLSLNVAYNANIPATCARVQEKVKSAIENMTGLKVGNVNIHIVSVEMENTKES